MTLKIATWNVNSIRSRLANLFDFIKLANPDILLLQELKCTEEQFPFLEFESLNYNIEIVGEKGRNGVAIFSKYPLYDINKKLPLYNIVEKDDEARYIEARFDYNGKSIKIASIYVPNGGPSSIDIQNDIEDVTTTDNFNKKMKFYDRLKIKFEKELKNNEIALFGGDYNVCPVLQIDVYSVSKDGSITCHYKERDKFKKFLDLGMLDIWRAINPDLREYSWWGYRPYYMWEKNLGYRLDAFLITPQTKQYINSCKIFAKGIRDKEKPSDHVPMMCEINI